MLDDIRKITEMQVLENQEKKFELDIMDIFALLNFSTAGSREKGWVK